MAFCGQCGFENPDGARFCGSCGADLTLQIVEDTPEPVVTEAPQASDPPVAPVTPTAPEPPVAPIVPEPPVTPTAPEPPVAPIVSELPVTPTAPVSPPPSTEKPQAPKPQTNENAGKGGGKGKTCLGIGCAIALVVVLALGGLGWWGYSYLQKNGMKWEELLNGGGSTATTTNNDENGTTGDFSNNEGMDEKEEGDGEEGDFDEKEIMEGMEKNEGMETTEGVEGEEEADKKETTENEEKAKVEEAKNTATGKKEKAKQLAQELGVPVVSYNALPKHDMYYLDKDSEIGVQCKISQQSGRATMGTVEVTHWFTGEKFKYNLQSCGNSIYLLANPKSGGGSTYLFVYEGGKRMLYGQKGSMKEINMK